MAIAKSINTVSYHHFLFPFRWDILCNGFMQDDIKEIKYKFDDRTNLKKTDLFFNNTGWTRTQIGKIKDVSLYNELTYFHEFVRRVIYDFEKDYADPVTRYYKYDLGLLKKKEFLIEAYCKNQDISPSDNGKSQDNFYIRRAVLEIEGISLHLYNTGIGVLSFSLANRKPTQSTPDDILFINELGRRIYPQFLGENYIWDTQRVFLPKSITLGDWTEDFSQYNDLSNLSFRNSFLPPAFIKKLFSERIIFSVEEKLSEDKILFTRVLDDRMFFLCWYGNSSFANEVGNNYKDSKWWYSYIFGDRSAGGSIANQAMMKKQLEDHTYKRWSDLGTLYGMSRDSFVCMSAEAEFFEKEDLPRLDMHMNTVYYQIAVLALVQRASVIKFSAEVAGLADMAKTHSDKETLNRIKDLYMNYIEFINKVYFREVTSQIQGVEIYNQFHKVMRIADDVRDLDGEIQELHNYAEMVKQYDMARRSESLNKFGFPLLIASLVAGILGINFIQDDPVLFKGKMDNEIWKALFLIFAFPVIYFLAYGIRFLIKRKK